MHVSATVGAPALGLQNLLSVYLCAVCVLISVVSACWRAADRRGPGAAGGERRPRVGRLTSRIGDFRCVTTRVIRFVIAKGETVTGPGVLVSVDDTSRSLGVRDKRQLDN